MTQLYQYTDNGVELTIVRQNTGRYGIILDDGKAGILSVELPSAKIDELRMALMAGFDPKRDNPSQMAIDTEPPHPAD